MELSREEVLKIAAKVAGGEGARLINHGLCRRSEESLGYLGKHLTLILELATEEGQRERRLFVKTYECRPNGEDFLGESGIFQREQDFYRMVVEDVKEATGTPDWCPNYHFSKERVLVLEDLSEEGFRMIEGRVGEWALDKTHLETALRTLASMHATSIMLERRQGKCLPDMYAPIFAKELLYDENKTEAPTRKWVTWQIQDLLEGVHHLTKYTNHQKKLIRENFEKQAMRIYVLSKQSDKYRNVLTHGDMWRNNLLFRYSDDGAPLECRFVDFQFVRYAPPAHDLMHLLHFAMKKETRDELESHLIRFYHENLFKRLKHLGVDADKEIGQEELLESCREYKELALTQCLLSLHYILGSVTLTAHAGSYEQYGNNLARHRKNYMADFFRQKRYADRITDIFQEYIDRIRIFFVCVKDKLIPEQFEISAASTTKGNATFCSEISSQTTAFVVEGLPCPKSLPITDLRCDTSGSNFFFEIRSDEKEYDLDGKSYNEQNLSFLKQTYTEVPLNLLHVQLLYLHPSVSSQSRKQNFK